MRRCAASGSIHSTVHTHLHAITHTDSPICINRHVRKTYRESVRLCVQTCTSYTEMCTNAQKTLPREIKTPIGMGELEAGWRRGVAEKKGRVGRGGRGC